MKLLGVALVLAGATWACSKRPGLPADVTFRGATLDKANDWSAGDVSGVVFVPPGEKLETASLQVGVLASSDHPSAAALHSWVMDQYHRSRTSQYYESLTSDEACRVGLPDAPEGRPFRPFVAVHVCRSGQGGSACAEADEALSEAILGRCLNRGASCWDEVCTQRWLLWRPELERILKGSTGR